jgi:Uncharacterized alpha/beta hydrolase domain (DUF2235)
MPTLDAQDLAFIAGEAQTRASATGKWGMSAEASANLSGLRFARGAQVATLTLRLHARGLTRKGVPWHGALRGLHGRHLELARTRRHRSLSRRAYVTETNVLRVFRGLTGIAPDPGHGYSQGNLLSTDGEAIYFSGVGTEPGTKFYEGITGEGIERRITKAYDFLAKRCKADDKIFGFGFSRGAFAVRSLAGFILYEGLRDEPGNVITQQYQQYRNHNAAHQANKSVDQQGRMVNFLGLWDTVSALIGDDPRYHDISALNVVNVAHALALDEQRNIFKPEYWISENGSDISQAQFFKKEVWFSGSHSNIGGGYVDDNLSNIAFFWVMKEAEATGLNSQLNSMLFWVRENPGAILRQEMSIVWDLQELWSKWTSKHGTSNRTIKSRQRIHESVVDRILDQTLRPQYTPLVTVDPERDDPLFNCRMLLDYRNPIDNSSPKQEWMEEWGFDAPAEEVVGAKEGMRTVMIEIPSELVPKVEELIATYARGVARD